MIATFILISAFVTAALLFWLHSYRQTRKPGVRAMCLALVLLDGAVLIGGLDPYIDLGFGIPALPQYAQHVCVLLSAYWLQIFCLHLTRPAAQIRRRSRTRSTLLIVALTGLTVFYVLGPLRYGLGAMPSNAGNQPWVTPYLAMYGGYLGLAMADTFWMARLAAHVPRRFLRLGLRLLGIGSGFGLLYVLHRLGYSLARALGATPPWNDTGPLGPNSLLILVSIAFLMSGVMTPPFGARWEARRAAAEVLPLWRAVTAVAPELVFKNKGDRLRSQITEIRDVLIGPLHPYLSPEVYQQVREASIEKGDTSDVAEATAEAAVIAVALEAKRRELPALTSTPLIIGDADDHDADEGDRFVRIGRAYTASPLVSNAVQEFADQHDHVH